MKKNKPYYLKYYQEWMQRGRMPDNGLCWSLATMPPGNYLAAVRDKLLPLFEPTDEDCQNFTVHSHSSKCGSFWASGDKEHRMYQFTPLRQTIVLFLAAMNNEL